MTESTLLQELISLTATRTPHVHALTYGDIHMNYGELHAAVNRCAAGLINLGLTRGERVAIYLEKRFEAVIASFGSAAAGAVFVPVNPLLKPDQVAFILHDCNVRVLVTSPERLSLLQAVLPACHDLRHVVVTESVELVDRGLVQVADPKQLIFWDDLCQSGPQGGHRVIDVDMVAILYTSGSTGKPKGVVLSHHNVALFFHSFDRCSRVPRAPGSPSPASPLTSPSWSSSGR